MYLPGGYAFDLPRVEYQVNHAHLLQSPYGIGEPRYAGPGGRFLAHQAGCPPYRFSIGNVAPWSGEGCQKQAQSMAAYDRAGSKLC